MKSLWRWLAICISSIVLSSTAGHAQERTAVQQSTGGMFEPNADEDQTPSVEPAAVSTSPAPIQAVPIGQRAARGLPANTEILLRMDEEVTTKGRTWDEGDNFNLSVVDDVMLGDYVVIPAGTRGVGVITWLTSKGAFGKSGKMDVELLYLRLNGRRISIDGTYRQEGEGNTAATIGGAIAADVFAGFITGRSGRIPQGRELMATLEKDLPVALPEGATIPTTTGPIQTRPASDADTATPVEPAGEPVVETKAEAVETSDGEPPDEASE